MPDAVDSRLVQLLGGEPPAGVVALSAADRTRLADLVEAARRQQARSLVESFERTLQHVPFPVRKLVRKVLTG